MSYVGEDLHEFLGDSVMEDLKSMPDVKFFSITASFVMSGTEVEIDVLNKFVCDVECFRADGYPASIEYKCGLVEEI